MYELQVESMNCGGCVRSVTRSVKSIDSKARVDVDLAAKMVRIASEASLDAVKSAITEAGYPVTASAAV
ncbi:heavy-metal-associated domain-containing protein [Noviherbaspirillum sp. L7-7A]|uniref:heavy-metal-associated domain-containing protein n=1 Tax=Noviherbaspirillum sp. L7-7A TaxID=2850560 RepID=UPI001C2C3D22|nr:heavy-metal-associated domain-containing protein [Noviherbaspirillum sp. L7-7A]MBV0881396.1 heavy-metal-associated domain-containing protein [Noviherbaspirillum sp. L7-7A]